MNASLNLSETRRNITEAACFHSDPLPSKVVRVIAYCIIIAISLLGNSAVVVVVFKNKAMRKTVNYFIVNMSVASLLVTVTYMPRVISLSFAGFAWQVHGLLGLIFCKIACFNEVAILVAIFTIIAISIDRFLAVVFPLRRGLITISICQAVIVCIWIAAPAAAFCEFYAIELRRYKGNIYCYLDMDHFFGKGSSKAFFKFIIIGAFAIPFTLILILYSCIVGVLIRRRRIPGDSSSVNDIQQKRRCATRRKVLKMVSMVVGTFVLCWLLYFIHFIVYSYGIMLPCDVMFIRLLLAHFHCAFSPFIYGFYNGNYRKGILALIPSTRATRINLESTGRQSQRVIPFAIRNNAAHAVNKGFEQEQTATEL